MAISRFGRYSDLFVIEDVLRGCFVCIGCLLQEKVPCLFGGMIYDDWECQTPKELLDHLNLHYYNDPPHKVSKVAFARVVEMWDVSRAEKEA